MSGMDLLFELGTEELPPLALARLSADLGDLVCNGLDELGLEHGAVQRYASPRRLAVLVQSVAGRQPDQTIERRGPSVAVAFDAQGQPTKAAEGFARSCGVAVDALERLANDKGEWLFYRATAHGAATVTLLPKLLAEAVRALPVPKRMRWGDLEESFVRPVHWIVALFGDQVVDLELFGVQSGRYTRGHRFHCPRPLKLAQPKDYASRLAEEGYVVADIDERRARVKRQVTEQGAAAGGVALAGAELLDEVTALVEWPVALAGSFDSRYLSLPREVLTATLEGHQRYFPVAGGDGKLLAAFVTVANLESRAPQEVRAGNERVVHPRLADALFFWEQDRKRPLDAYLPSLEHVAFQHQLGSLADKTRRIESLGAWLCEAAGASAQHVARASRLCKADLLTAMVYEFTELQGTMGKHYALAGGEDPEVAQALEEQYRPRHAGDDLPASATGCVLALADRADTIAGIFAIDQRPSGEKDPFGLRRAALGLVRILIEREIDLDLYALVVQALALQPVDRQSANLAEDVYAFIIERLRSHYLSAGVPVEVFSAVAATRTTRPLDLARRLDGVRQFLRLPQAAQLTAAHKRVRNILKQVHGGDSIDTDALQEEAERALYERVAALESRVTVLIERADYAQALAALAGLQAPVDRFFDEVMVMSDDARVRSNRLALLRRLDRLCRAAADLSCLPG